MGLVSFLPWKREKSERKRTETESRGRSQIEICISKPTNCLGCGCENQPGQRFCGNCGRLLV